MRKTSNKMARVNSEVQKVISEVLQTQVTDKRIHPMTTVLSCDVSTDLKYCKVYVTNFESAANREETLKGLQSAAPYIRRCLASILNMRVTPELRFQFDDTLEMGLRMEKLIADTIRKDEESHEKH